MKFSHMIYNNEKFRDHFLQVWLDPGAQTKHLASLSPLSAFHSVEIGLTMAPSGPPHKWQQNCCSPFITS